jgi:hypothetical protein
MNDIFGKILSWFILGQIQALSWSCDNCIDLAHFSRVSLQTSRILS